MGIIVPVPKDKRGDLSSVDNYRPRTLIPVIFKLFESLLVVKFSKYLRSDDLQIGYKRKLGCSHAIFLLRNVIEHFNSKGSDVYIAALDASKAFDRVNHFSLYSILIKAGLPRHFIDLLIRWYSMLRACARWNNVLSDPFLN